MGYIYSIRNTINDLCYIGQTKRELRLRWKEHKTKYPEGHKKLYKLQRAFIKYGLESFEFRLICVCFDDALDAMEKLYIKRYNSFGENGYNLTEGGLNARHSSQQMEKRRETTMTRFPDFHKGIKNPWYGHRHSQQSRNLISEAQFKAVRQYSMGEKFIAEYESVTAAVTALSMNLNARHHIGECCNGKRKSTQGYLWKWVPQAGQETMSYEQVAKRIKLKH